MPFRSFRNNTDARVPGKAEAWANLAWLLSAYARVRPYSGLTYPFWDCFLDNQPPQ